MKIFEVRDGSAVSRIDRATHGATFSPENLQFDSAEATATLTFEHSRIGEAVVIEPASPPIWRIRVPVRAWRLSFRNVSAVDVDDQAQVGWYQIDDLSWRDGLFLLEAIPTLTISMTGGELPEIDVCASDTIISWKTFKRLALRRPSLIQEDPLL